MKYLDSLAATFTIGLASVAVWRFLALDTITNWLRGRIFREVPEDQELTRTDRLRVWGFYWLTCPWCSGAWITALIVILTDILIGLPAPLLVFAAARYVTGWIGSKENTL